MRKSGSKYKVAILGLGHWYMAYGLGRALRESTKAELVAAAWREPDHLGEITRTFGIKGYGDNHLVTVLGQFDPKLVKMAPHGERAED